MSHGQNVAGQNVARQNVADISSRTKCCGQIVADKMLHGQNVARTKRCKKNVALTKMLQGPNQAKKTSSHEKTFSQNKNLCGLNGAWIFRWKLRAPRD
jgi:hypothetical protein